MSDEILVSFKPKPGYDLIFRPWYVHPRTKKVVYPKSGKVFPIWVKNRRQMILPLDGDGAELN
jgi:hypothetical protein